MTGSPPAAHRLVRAAALLLALATAASLLVLLPGTGRAASVPVAGSGAPTVRVENPPGPRTDVDGAPVDAHDGELVQLSDGTFALYGTSYECGFRLNDPTSPFCGFSVYSSPDLSAWTYRGELFDASTEVWQDRCTRGRFGCYRPHVARSPATGDWVLWVNTSDEGPGYRVLVSDDPFGPFVEVDPPRLAVRDRSAGAHAYGDHALHVDDDGRGWVVYTVIGNAGLHDLAVEELDPTLTTGTGRAVRLPYDIVESPDLVQDGARWHLLFSDPACPYCGTTTGHAWAPSPLGPWTRTGLLDGATCGGQVAGVSEVVVAGTERLVLASDLWRRGRANQADAGFALVPLHLRGTATPEVECRDAWQVGPARRVRAAGAETAGS